MKAKFTLTFIVLIICFGTLSEVFAINGNSTTYHSKINDTKLVASSNFSNTETTIAQSDVAAGLDEFPNLHPLVVHFPIVLLLFAVFLQLIQLFVLKRTLDWVILLMVGTGCIGAYVAGTFVHPHTEGLTEIAKKVLEQHDKYALWTLWSSALAAVLKIVSLFWYKLKRGFEIGVFVVMAFAAYSVAQAGHYGSQLVYIEGVGPQGKYLGDETEEGQVDDAGHSH